MRTVHFALLGLLLAAPASAMPSELARQVWLVPGGFDPKREPDGNSVVWQGAGGLVVLDTGRHSSHSDALFSLAETRAVPVAVIINSHWHLDHVTGNLRLKAHWPNVTVFASNAIDAALTGFLAKSAVSSNAALATPGLPAETREDIQLDLATIAQSEKLRPDVVVRQSQTLVLAGTRLRLNLTAGATTGDIWVYDSVHRLVAVGDLVTLPVPFLDTADVKAWRRALGVIAATDFRVLVPGHGPVMNRSDFSRYRSAFDHLLDCAASQKAPARCGDDWVSDAEGLLAPEDESRARKMIGYYVAHLRHPA